MSKKIALVTGGTGGIGTQICRRLADSDYFVVANHLEFEREAAQDWREHLSADGYDFGLVAGGATEEFDHL